MNTTPEDLPRSTEAENAARIAASWARRVAARCVDGVRLLRRVLVVGQMEEMERELEARGVRVTTAAAGQLPEGPFDLVVLGPEAVFAGRDDNRSLLSDLASRLRSGGRAVVITGGGQDGSEYGRLMQGAGFDPPAVVEEQGVPGGTLLVSRLRLWKAGRVPSSTG